MTAGMAGSLQAQTNDAAPAAAADGQTPSAAPAAVKPPHADPCAQDQQKFCPDAKTRRDVATCLAAHKDDLTKACQAKSDKMNAGMSKYDAACKDDVAKLCPDAKDRKAVGQCLTKNEADVSSACKDARTAWMKHARKKPAAASSEAATPSDKPIQSPAAPSAPTNTQAPAASGQ
jgi:hypothetical protein